ncbi:hypothetical protein ACFWBX_06460 [Streptomyces sp. NPDC059991]|uniref:hypothetical protein n=1 Tax=Streptomyces sp. NPDC059991 TaxID=3347028 RepID=UPI0036A722B0
MTHLHTALAATPTPLAMPPRQRIEAAQSELVPPQGGALIIGTAFQVVLTKAGEFSRAVLERVEQLQPAGAGPVLADPEQPFWFWLIPAGVRWSHPNGFCYRRGGIELPSLGRTQPPGAYWVRAPRAHWMGALTLATALDDIARPSRPLPALLSPRAAAAPTTAGEAQ